LDVPIGNKNGARGWWNSPSPWEPLIKQEIPMSTITATRRAVNPTRRTRVLFDATRRHPAPRTFGRGLLRPLPTYRAPYTAADAAWAAQAFSRPVTAYDLHLEALAKEAEAQDRLERGCLL
jgi:hypothetical protein